MTSVKEPVIREAEFTDCQAVLELQRSVGYLGILQEDWNWLWGKNPAYSSADPRLPIGWVMEANGEIVGYLGNFPSSYRYGDRTLKAATATGFAVDKAYRGFSLRLVTASFKQNGAELFLNTTASEATSQIFQRFGSVPLPIPSFNQTLFWVLRSRPFARSYLNRRSLPPSVTKIGSYLAGPVLFGDTIFRGRKPKTTSGSRAYRIDLLGLSELGTDFDELWSRKLGEGKRLLACRNSETLKWRLSVPGNRQTVKILGCHESNRLVGYVLVANEYLPHLDLPRTRIIDLLVEGDDPETVGALLRAAYDNAKLEGSYILETTGFPLAIHQLLKSSNPYLRAVPYPTFLYAATDKTIHQEFTEAGVWYPSAFDGDGGL